MLRLQHLAAELEWVLPGGMGELVDEAFGVDRVLFGVNAAPEAGPDVSVAHRMVDKHIRYVIAEFAFGPARVEALEPPPGPCRPSNSAAGRWPGSIGLKCACASRRHCRPRPVRRAICIA